MIEKLLLKLRARDDIDGDEEQALRDAVGETTDVRPGETVIRAGQQIDRSVLLLKGLMCRYKDVSSGERQIMELQIAGDFLDLHGFTLKRLDHSVLCLSPARIAYAPHERLKVITEQYPHLTRLLWFSTNLDAAIHREWMVSLGRRTAAQRLAHLFCELHVRLGLVGLANASGYELPLSQIVLAECLGLTPVHVNRMLKELRELGLATFRNGRVEIQDLERLRRLAEFDPAYLYLERQPR